MIIDFYVRCLIKMGSMKQISEVVDENNNNNNNDSKSVLDNFDR